MYQTIIYNNCKYQDLISKNVGVGRGAVRVKNGLKMSKNVGYIVVMVVGLYLTNQFFIYMGPRPARFTARYSKYYKYYFCNIF